LVFGWASLGDEPLVLPKALAGLQCIAKQVVRAVYNCNLYYTKPPRLIAYQGRRGGEGEKKYIY